MRRPRTFFLVSVVSALALALVAGVTPASAVDEPHPISVEVKANYVIVTFDQPIFGRDKVVDWWVVNTDGYQVGLNRVIGCANLPVDELEDPKTCPLRHDQRILQMDPQRWAEIGHDLLVVSYYFAPIGDPGDRYHNLASPRQYVADFDWYL